MELDTRFDFSSPSPDDHTISESECAVTHRNMKEPPARRGIPDQGLASLHNPRHHTGLRSRLHHQPLARFGGTSL